MPRIITVNGVRFPQPNILALQYGVTEDEAKLWIQAGHIPQRALLGLEGKPLMKVGDAADIFRIKRHTVRDNIDLFPTATTSGNITRPYEQGVLAWFGGVHPGLLFSTGEITTLYGLKARTLESWTQHGNLTAFYTPGGQARYRLKDVEDYLRSRA